MAQQYRALDSFPEDWGSVPTHGGLSVTSVLGDFKPSLTFLGIRHGTHSAQKYKTKQSHT